MPSRVLTVDPADPDRAAIQEAVGVLRSGGIVAIPTDTFYGLAVDPRNDAAVAALFAAKGRAAEVRLPLVAADVEQVARAAGELPPVGRRLAERFWPGPLSLVIPASACLARAVHAGSNVVAVRVPAHEVPRRLAAAAGHPLTATSANRSGEPPAATAGDVVTALGGRVELILDAGPAPGGAPSTIIDVTQDTARLVRNGAVPWDRVLQFL